MARNIIETIMGAVVLAVAGGFLYFAYDQGSVTNIDGYVVNARFDDITGISNGSDVRVAGMKIGVVNDLSFNEQSYQATAHLMIDGNVKLPEDSSASVVSSGLLGEKFIKLEPGGSDKTLDSGDTIKFTQSSVSFEELIGKFVFSSGGVDDSSKSQATSSGDAEKDNNPFSLDF
ncbi:MAG: outer membrane lipid asymmetry maintenance protein MlaD [Rickettsiales bacterium]|nr:outer membrane lipid asymmetry maintenance protein MlaD [Rickettsiales bacterium]